MSRMDKLYRETFRFKTFVKGWGNPDLILKIIENQRIICNKQSCQNVIPPIQVNTTKTLETGSAIIVEGNFVSPFHSLFPQILDENNRIARFQLLIPKNWNTRFKPLCIQFAGTGDQKFDRRARFLGKPLLKNGVASLIHINPYYGDRKPRDQMASRLNYLSDLFVMGGALIMETQVLVNWAKSRQFHPIGIHGISMGGHMANLGASVYPDPICLIPCLSWTTASSVFIKGVLNVAVDWEMMAQQYHSDDIFSNTIRSAIQPPIFREDLLQKRNSLATASLRHATPSAGKSTAVRLESSERKFHSLGDDDANLPLRNFSSESSNDHNNGGNVQKKPTAGASLSTKLRSSLTDFRPVVLNRAMDLLTSLYSRDKITTADLEQVHRDESSMSQAMTTRRWFSQSDQMDPETVQFMQDMLDYFTHLANYPVPTDTRLTSFVVAEKDAYFPMEGMPHIHDIWGPECSVRVLRGLGHVEAYLRNAFFDHHFENAIVESLNRYVELYEKEPGPFGLKKKK